MKNSVKIIITTIIVILGVSIFNLTRTENKNNNLSLLLDYSRNVSHIGIINAIEENYFQAEDVSVDVTDNSSQSVRKLVDAKKYDLGISYQESLTLANNKGANLVSIATIVQKNPSCYGYRADHNISKPADLFSKNFAYDGSEVTDYILNLSAKAQGTTFTGKKITTSVNDYLVNTNSEIDFAYEYDYWGPILAKSKNNDVGCHNITDMIGINYYSPIIITQKDILSEKSTQIKKFKKAIERGYILSLNNPDLSSKNLAKQTGLEIDVALKTIQKFNEYAFKNNTWGFQDENIWREYTNLLFKEKIIDKTNYNDWFENV
jgi:ABC-type nitrate/sulfonate/bicarbonate transport system substrate-binding protein